MKHTNKFVYILVFCLLLTINLPIYTQDQEDQEDRVVDITEISLESLLNMEVTVAGKKSQTIASSPGIISLITADDIKKLGILNLVDLFSYIPGFTVTDNYWTREIVTSREVFQAIYNDKILLLIDGIPSYEAINTEYYLDILPIEAVDRIEIIRGPGSTLYGTNAFAGVVNIITKKGGSVDGVEFKATTGSFSMFEKTVIAGHRFEAQELELFFAGNIRSEEGYTHLIPFDETGAINIRQSYRKEFSRAHLRLDYKDFTMSLQVLDYDYDHFGVLPVAWARGIARHNTWNLNLSHSYMFNRKLSSKNMFRMMSQIRDNEAGIFGVLFPGSDIRADGQKAEAPTYMGWKSMIYQFETQWNYTFSPVLSLVAGAAIEKKDPYNISTISDEWGLNSEERIVGFNGSYSYPPEKNLLDYGIYMQGDFRLKRFGFVGGVRYTYMGVAKKSFVAPRTAFIYQLSKNLSIKALFGIAFRSPTIYESEVYGKDALYGGKTAINPERVSSYELGLDYVGKKLSARANYYYMTVNDIIGRRPLTPQEKVTLGAAAGVIYGNINNQRLSGFEVEIKAYPLVNLDFFANSSFRTGTNRDTGEPLNYISKALFSGGFNLKVPALKARISPNFYYVGSREGMAVNGNVYTYDGYFLFNANMGFLFSKRFELNLIVKNLFDKRYYYPEMTRNNIGIQLPGNSPRAIFFQCIYKVGL